MLLNPPKLRRIPNTLRFSAGIALAFLASHVTAQIPMSGDAYTQDFNSLAEAGSGVIWSNGVTLTGWYASKSVSPTEVTNYNAGVGSSTAGALYSFGTDFGERALGSLSSATPGNLAFGVRFINDTGFARTNIAIAYTGEQWRAGNSSTQTLTFSYRIGNSLTNADARETLPWIFFPALDFTTPNTNSPQALVGNDSTNRTVFTNVILTGLVVPAGQELFLRWFDADDPGFDSAFAIDDVTVHFGDAVTNAPPPPAVAAFSLVHYNIKGNFASDWTTNAPQVQAIARKLQYLDPDIITLNEIPNGLRYEMTNWMTAFFPDYQLAISAGTDGAIRSGVISRFSIIHSNSWFDNASLTNFGYNGIFTRDLFETEVAVPGFPQPLHVFVTHLKSGATADDAARRAAEARVISNFFVNGFLATNAFRPYLLAGDLNEDIAHPPTGSQQPIETLTNSSGLVLITPLNPFTLSDETHSIQGTLDRRFDYVFPNGLLASNIATSQIFRTDFLNPVPPNLNSNDSIVASDHLPVVFTFNNPYHVPFRFVSFGVSNTLLTVGWESVKGQAYGIAGSEDFNAWETIVTGQVATGSVSTYSIPISDAPRFFRAFRVQ